jgi:hypothetical protein
MKLQNLIAIGIIAFATNAAMADPAADAATDNNAPLTRAQVKQELRRARDVGELTATGDSADYPHQQIPGNSTLTRSDVRHEVLVARASGELIPAGEGDDAFVARSTDTVASSLTRADVKTATLRARDAGQLVPAGEGDDTTQARDRTQSNYARTAQSAGKSASMLASK